MELVRYMCQKEGMSQVELSRTLGKSDRYISATLSAQKDVSTRSLVSVCEALGYDLLARSRADGEELPITLD